MTVAVGRPTSSGRTTAGAPHAPPSAPQQGPPAIPPFGAGTPEFDSGIPPFGAGIPPFATPGGPGAGNPGIPASPGYGAPRPQAPGDLPPGYAMPPGYSMPPGYAMPPPPPPSAQAVTAGRAPASPSPSPVLPGSTLPPPPDGVAFGPARTPGSMAPSAARPSHPTALSPLAPPVVLHGAGIAAAMPPSLAGVLPPPPVGSYPAVTTGPVQATDPKLAAFEENPYTLRRHGYVGPPPTRRRAHHPLRAVTVLLVLAVAGGVVGYRLVRPSAHRSPDTVAVAFYSALASGNSSAAASEVEPQQQAAAASALDLPAVRQFVAQALHGNVVENGTTQPAGAETAVEPQVCGAGLSCTPTLTVPTVKVAGAWYVDWNSWLQSLPPALVHPAP